jgi:hypothetical protein
MTTDTDTQAIAASMEPNASQKHLASMVEKQQAFESEVAAKNQRWQDYEFGPPPSDTRTPLEKLGPPPEQPAGDSQRQWRRYKRQMEGWTNQKNFILEQEENTRRQSQEERLSRVDAEAEALKRRQLELGVSQQEKEVELFTTAQQQSAAFLQNYKPGMPRQEMMSLLAQNPMAFGDKTVQAFYQAEKSAWEAQEAMDAAAAQEGVSKQENLENIKRDVARRMVDANLPMTKVQMALNSPDPELAANTMIAEAKQSKPSDTTGGLQTRLQNKQIELEVEQKALERLSQKEGNESPLVKEQQDKIAMLQDEISAIDSRVANAAQSKESGDTPEESITVTSQEQLDELSPDKWVRGPSGVVTQVKDLAKQSKPSDTTGGDTPEEAIIVTSQEQLVGLSPDTWVRTPDGVVMQVKDIPPKD